MNPEFRRNLWLEFSTERLLIIPAVVILSLIAISGTLGRPAAITFATYGAIAIAIVWGCTLSSSSFLGEITGRTWDMQRASSMSGWQMTWGKLFGSTSYPWYGVAIVFVAWLSLDGPTSFSRNEWLVLLPAAVLAHAVALIAALYVAIDGRVHVRSARQAAAVGVLAGIASLQASRALAAATAPDWYLLSLDRRWVVVASALFLCAWAIVGAWRAMSAALQIPLRAWAWPLFLVTMSVWLAGFARGDDPDTLVSRRLYLALAMTWIATWIAALVDTKSPVRLRQWRAAVSSGDAGQIFARTPAWVIGLPVVVVAAAGVALTDRLGLGPSRLFGSLSTVEALLGDLMTRSGGWLTLAAAFLFLWRDIAIMYWSGLIGRGRRVPALIYLAGLYILVPATLLSLDALTLLPAFAPMPFANGIFDIAFIVLVLQVVAATAIAAHAIRRFTRLDPERS
jgi:hypothetical protein